MSASSWTDVHVATRDRKLVALLTSTLQKLDDFSSSASDAQLYATRVVQTLRQISAHSEDFRDRVAGIVANVHNLRGEIHEQNITPDELARMDETEMLSRAQKREQRVLSRKRAREQTNFDKTSMLCTKCGLIRRDRLNINELALDSEENGTQFDYNFDNVCTCSHSSSDETASSDEDDGNDTASQGCTDGGEGGASKKNVRRQNCASSDTATTSTQRAHTRTLE